MLSFIAFLIFINMLVAPLLLMLEGGFRFATNGDFSATYMAEKYQTFKYRWILEQFNMWADADSMGLWLLCDVVLGLVTVFFMCLFGYWLVIPMGILGVLTGSRWYFQNK